MSDHVAGTDAAGLLEATKKLAADWGATQVFWRDQKSREFAAQYLADLPQFAKQAAAAVGEIDALLRKVVADCE